MPPAPKKSKKEKQAEKEAELGMRDAPPRIQPGGECGERGATLEERLVCARDPHASRARSCVLAARLEEEKRIEEERLAKEKAEEEKRMAEELAARMAQEVAAQAEFDALIEEEGAANATMYAERAATLSREQLASFASDEWAVFISCEPLPDVQREAEVNTFLTEWGEKPRDGAEALDKTLADCTLCTELLSSLQLEAAYAAARHETKQATWQHEIQLDLKREMQRKLDGATADFLQRAEEFANAKHECVTCVPAAGCRFGLWVNLAKNPRVKAIDYAELAIGIELPKALALASIAVRTTHYATDIVSPYAPAEVRDASPWMTLGGVVDVDLLTLPPPSKKIKGWTIRPVTEMSTTTVRMEYPIPAADGSLPPAGTAPPLRISYIIDPKVILPETIEHVGYWDAETSGWKEDAIIDVEFAADSRTLSFSSTTLTSLALLQPTHLELPYKDWIFSPSNVSAGALHLKTQRFDIHIDVSAAGCVLRAPARPELTPLIGVPMAAAKLVLRLRACGINLQPKDADAAKLVKITPKDATLEQELHEALTPLIASYQMAPSRWNQSRGAGKCTVRLNKGEASFDTEGEVAPPPADPYGASVADWPCLEFSKRRAVMISALDADATCNESPLNGGVAHSSPLECLKGDDPDVADVLLSSSRLYQDNVRQLLDELRLFSFTTG